MLSPDGGAGHGYTRQKGRKEEEEEEEEDGVTEGGGRRHLKAAIKKSGMAPTS